MRSLSKAVRAVIGNSLVILLVLANVAIARPAEAGWDNDICWNPETQMNEPCCTWCWIWCRCDLASTGGDRR